MDKMPCIYFLIYIIFGTIFTGQIVCLGNSLSQILDGTQIRQSRSPHQLYRRMCPYGASRESCFYSQLSMFMRLHDGLSDPVHMRNIGKRSEGGADDAAEDESALQSRVTYPDVLVGDGLGTPQEESKLLGTPFSSDAATDGALQSKSNAQQFGFLTNRLKNTLNYKYLTSSLPWLSNPGGTEGNNGDSAQYISSPRKRQIICPRGMSRMLCYDKALAFYMQLLRTMGDQ